MRLQSKVGRVMSPNSQTVTRMNRSTSGLEGTVNGHGSTNGTPNGAVSGTANGQNAPNENTSGMNGGT